MESLLAEYTRAIAVASPPTQIELELRINGVDRPIFESTVRALIAAGHKPVLECSVNTISESARPDRGDRSQSHHQPAHNTSSQMIRKIVFENGKATSDTYLEKKRLIKSVWVPGPLKYSVGLSSETPITKFPSTKDALMRFKARIMFTPKNTCWRIDMTCVKTGKLDEIGNHVVNIKQEMFPAKLTADNFLKTMKFDMVTEYEIEIEYVGAVNAASPQTPTTDDITAAANMILDIMSPNHAADLEYQREIMHVAEYVFTEKSILDQFRHGARLKQLGNQAITLSKQEYYGEIFPPDGYLATLKLDGVRTFASVQGSQCRLLGADLITMGVDSPGAVTICDCELMGTTLYIFDVLVIEDKSVISMGLRERITHAPAAAAIIQAIVGDKYAVEAKKYTTLNALTLEKDFKMVWQPDMKTPNDGIIISEPSMPYRDTKNYKWKPLNKTTIDFLAILCPPKMLGVKPYIVKKGFDLYLLFVGISHQLREKIGMGFIGGYRSIFPGDYGHYYPIQFSPSADPTAYLYYAKAGSDYDHKIIELGRSDESDPNYTDQTWQFHRIRTDRANEKNYYGNDFRIAELTYSGFIDPFKFENLWTRDVSYFSSIAAEVSDTYKAGNQARRYVISFAIKQNFTGAKWIIDECAGRGGDLHRYQECGVDNALFIDIDAAAIVELIQRRFSMRRELQRKRGGANTPKQPADIVKDVSAMTVHTLVADMKTPVDDLCASVYQFHVVPGLIDGIVCNFALHYICDTIENLRNILTFNARMLKPGGVFMFTVMDGKAIFELLKTLRPGEMWELREDTASAPKHAIRKDYSGSTLTACGQMIAVKLPFAADLVSEPLCNLDTVIAEGKRLGFALEFNENMSDTLRIHNAKQMIDRLTPVDISWLKLYRLVTMRLVGVKSGGKTRVHTSKNKT